jgi:hypothetical protein
MSKMCARLTRLYVHCREQYPALPTRKHERSQHACEHVAKYKTELAEVRTELEAKKSELEAARSRLMDAENGRANVSASALLLPRAEQRQRYCAPRLARL